jgi:dTDP-4-amino-4,6-dideoxygalactose transaminase
MPGQPGDAENVHHSFPVVIASSTNDIRQYARKKGVETAMAFGATVLSRFAGSQLVEGEAEAESDSAIADGEFPAARALGLRCVRFPLYPALTSREVTTIERVLSTLP